MIRRIPTGIVALVLMISATVSADPVGGLGDRAVEPSCLDAAIDRIERRYEGIKDLRADFVQVTQSGALAGDGASVSGTVTLAKPSKMRWVYANPSSLLISDGHTMWIYDPEFNEVQKMPVPDEYLSGASIQFLLGGGNIRKEFEVVERGCSPDTLEIELTPRQPATYERLTVTANAGTGDLLRTAIVDLVGNVTEVTFSNLQVDLDPPPETFQFDPPTGAKILEITP